MLQTLPGGNIVCVPLLNLFVLHMIYCIQYYRDRSKRDRPARKKIVNSFKVEPTNDNNKYDKLQKLAARQSHSGHIFVTVTFQVIVFL